MHRLLPLAPLAPLAAALLAVGGCASSGPPDVPPGVDRAHVHFSEPVAAEGEPAPDFDLRRADGKGRVRLSDLRGKPVVLVFGSFT